MMRQKMAADAAERRHPERVAERIRYREIANLALAEMKEKYPVLTKDNFDEVRDYLDRRVQELLKI